uniref:Uncharacterized protein n=1 Tax=Tanacetum cinerariifolium TaxID=118510 RepID=A0A6L2M7I2_TANCI|nr:hypothetical protein [Tanacetum cinerariifolium]
MTSVQLYAWKGYTSPPLKLRCNKSKKKRGDVKEVLIDDEFFDLEKETLREGNEIAKVFKIKTEIFLFETPLCKEFKDFNHLLQSDVDVLTGYLPGFKTYKNHKNAWIYEWINEVPWVGEKTLLEYTIWKEPTDDICLECKLLHFKRDRFKERRRKLLGIPYKKPPTFKFEKFKVIKYLFEPAEEHVAIREYDNDIWQYGRGENANEEPVSNLTNTPNVIKSLSMGSSNVINVGKLSVRAHEDNESDVNDVCDETWKLKASKGTGRGSEIGILSNGSSHKAEIQPNELQAKVVAKHYKPLPVF